jgi:hypothetical protein
MASRHLPPRSSSGITNCAAEKFAASKARLPPSSLSASPASAPPRSPPPASRRAGSSSGKGPACGAGASRGRTARWRLAARARSDPSSTSIAETRSRSAGGRLGRLEECVELPAAARVISIGSRRAPENCGAIGFARRAHARNVIPPSAPAGAPRERIRRGSGIARHHARKQRRRHHGEYPAKVQSLVAEFSSAPSGVGERSPMYAL